MKPGAVDEGELTAFEKVRLKRRAREAMRGPLVPDICTDKECFALADEFERLLEAYHRLKEKYDKLQSK